MRPAGWSVVVALLLIIPLRAADDPKKDPPKAEEKKPPVRTETILGKVVAVESQRQTIKIETNKQNPVMLTAIKFANDSYKDARKIRNLQERAAAFKEIDDKIKEYQRNLYIFTVDAGTDNTVRLPQPKETFDDMGNIKKITPKDRAKMMGKDKMFDGDWADLKMGQVVTVTYVAPPPPKKGKPDDLAPSGDGNLQSTKVTVVQDLPQQPKR